jgi:hypothetical protein
MYYNRDDIPRALAREYRVGVDSLPDIRVYIIKSNASLLV